MVRVQGEITLPESLGGPKRKVDPHTLLAELKDWRMNRQRGGYESSTLDDAIEFVKEHLT